MYVPPAFRFSDQAEIRAFCLAHPFATLVTSDEDGLFATQLPVILKDEGPLGAFAGHVARANPHWSRAPGPREALLIFQGPQAYVTPSWYETKRETGKVVPTWNYASVHARGRLTWPTDPDFLERNLADLTAMHEARFPHPWAMHDAPADFLNMQMRAIVGVWFEVTGVDAKMKMSQNRPAADVTGVVAGLAASQAPVDREVADLVAAHRRG